MKINLNMNYFIVIKENHIKDIQLEDPTHSVIETHINDENIIILMWNGIAYKNNIIYGVKWCIQEPDIEYSNQYKKETFQPQLFVPYKYITLFEEKYKELVSLNNLDNKIDDMKMYKVNNEIDIIIIEKHIYNKKEHNLMEPIISFQIKEIIMNPKEILLNKEEERKMEEERKKEERKMEEGKMEEIKEEKKEEKKMEDEEIKEGKMEEETKEGKMEEKKEDEEIIDDEGNITYEFVII